MKKLASVLAMAGLGLAISGCSFLPSWLGGSGGGGGATDMAKMMKDSAQAPWVVSVHDGMAVGQYAVVEMMGGTKQWWGCTGTKDDMNVVEMRMDMAGQGWITYAYVVDGEGNVKQAFLANYDPEAEELEEGYEIKIMEKPEPTDAPAGDEPESGEETVNAAGRDWACKWYKSGDSKTWMAESDGWFNKIIKAEYQGKVSMQLVEIGADATLGLKWPGEGGE